ncbi:rhodanese-like domain-containing protein [Bdellovibrionota bacterium FG-1]
MTANIQQYLIPLVLAAFIGWRFLKFRLVRKQLPNLLAQGGIVVDVRSPGEYAVKSRPGSRNIPLGEFEKTIVSFDREKPIIVCCASGARSAVALGILKRQGFKNIVNAGPWSNTVV